MFIDGSAYVSNNAINTYDGLATLYLSGTFTVDGTSQLCGGVSGGTAISPPGTRTPTSSGSSRTADAAGYSVLLENSAHFQGSIYATNNVLAENSTQFDGPMVANSFTAGELGADP